MATHAGWLQVQRQLTALSGHMHLIISLIPYRITFGLPAKTINYVIKNSTNKYSVLCIQRASYQQHVNKE